MKRHLFWIAELFIWLLILILVSNLILFFKYNHKKNFNTYQIFLPDVDGLINGSPVRLMGIQVGYVNQIDIAGENIYVKFIITEPEVNIPKGAKATVEFTGLGGSKSLEIYMPDADKLTSNKFIIPQPPKRIHDSLGLLNDMFNKLIDITYSVSHFMNELGLIKHKRQSAVCEETTIDYFLEVSNKAIDKAQTQCDKINDKLNKTKEGENGKYYGKNQLGADKNN